MASFFLPLWRISYSWVDSQACKPHSDPCSGLGAVHACTRFLWPSMGDLDLWPNDLVAVISVIGPANN